MSSISLGANEYATSEGLVNRKMQTLHSAEEQYYSEECTDTQAGTFCTTPHDTDSWTPIGITDLNDGYQQDTEPYTDHWVTSNAAESNPDVVSSPSPNNGVGAVTEDPVFDGGFAGKCPVGEKWQYVQSESRWRCTGELQYNHKAIVPNIQVQDTNGKETVGLFLNDQFKNGLLNSWADRYSDVPPSDISVSSADVTCYAGTDWSSVKDDSNLYFKKSVNVPSSIGKPGLAVTGEVQMKNYDRYSCDWHFHVEDGDSTTPGQVGGADGIQTGGKEPLSFQEFSDMISDKTGRSVSPMQLRPSDPDMPNKVTLTTDTTGDESLETLGQEWSSQNQ